MAMNDRRRYSRTKKHTVVSYSVLDNGREKDGFAFVLDGGTGGVRFRSKRSLYKNCKIYIRLHAQEWGEDLIGLFQDGNADSVEMIGMVMWCQASDEIPGEYEVGARFVGFTEH